MNENQRIELSDTPLDCLMKLSEGNPGALTAMMKLMKEAPAIDPDSFFGPLSPLISLDAMGIYGSHVWILWKDVCEQSAVNAETLFRAVQLGMLRESLVTDAARTGKHSFDFAALLAKVRTQLPDFGRAALPA